MQVKPVIKEAAKNITLPSLNGISPITQTDLSPTTKNDIHLENINLRPMVGESSSQELKQQKSVADISSPSILGDDCNNDINSVISVLIKKDKSQVVIKKNKITVKSYRLRDNSPGPDEICCLKEGYQLGKKIGEGAYSKVKAAEVLPDKIKRDGKIGKLVKNNGHPLVAVKILDKDKAPSEYTTKFIGREIQALHRIRGHPNVVEIYDVFETSDFLFIITELCQKGDMCQYINAHTEAGHCGITESKARDFFIQICQGMQYCHERGVVHRDFKCENVLICDDEETVKISDFGFACTVPNKRLMLATPCGSYSYAAPEVLFGKSYDPFMADVWSLGVVLFCMLNGTTPYGHIQLSMMEDYMKTQRVQFQKISKESKLLIKQLLQYDPRKRLKLTDILKSPWVNKKKVNIVERLYAPVVPDRSHLVDMIHKFKVPTTPNHSTEHKQCINFSRISFGNDSISLKSRQPNRERDRYFHVRPVLKRTRMSVVEFKERLGINITQPQPIAQILKNIISGTKNMGGAGDEIQGHKIPALPGNLSTLQGDSNQHMIEYLAEMWVDIDKDRGTTVTQSSDNYRLHTAPAQINTGSKTLSDDQEINLVTNAKENEDTVTEAIRNVEKTEGNNLNGNSTVVGHPPQGAQCCCCQQVSLDDDAGTEVSFCTCSNPETLLTGSTYTVHLPQPQNDAPQSPSPPIVTKQVEYRDVYEEPKMGHKRLSTTPVDQRWATPLPQPNWRDMANLYKTNTSLTVAEKARAVNDRAERILARARVRNYNAPYDSNLYKYESNARSSSENNNKYYGREIMTKSTKLNNTSGVMEPTQLYKKPNTDKMNQNMNKLKPTTMKISIVKNLTKEEGGSGHRQALALVAKEKLALNQDYGDNDNRDYITGSPQKQSLQYTANQSVIEESRAAVLLNGNQHDAALVRALTELSDCPECARSQLEGIDTTTYSLTSKRSQTVNVEETMKVKGDHHDAAEQIQTEIVEDALKVQDDHDVVNDVSNKDNIGEKTDEICELKDVPDETDDKNEDKEIKGCTELENNLETDCENKADEEYQDIEERPGSAELIKKTSIETVESDCNSLDEELVNIADMEDPEDPLNPQFTPIESPPMPPEVQHLVSVEAKSVSPMMRERLYFLKPRKTESEKSSVLPNKDDHIYERHARATPVKEKYLSEEVSAEIKKSRKLISRKGARTSQEIISGSYIPNQFSNKIPRGRVKNLPITTDVSRLVNCNIDRDNKSLPVLQVHKSHMSRHIVYSNQPTKRDLIKPEKSKATRQRTKSPFPNPMSNPSLWQNNPETHQIRDEARSTPTIACPLLPQKVHYTKELTRRHFRTKTVTPDVPPYNPFDEEPSPFEVQPLFPQKTGNLLPPVKNLSFDEKLSNKKRTLIAGIPRQY